jgi:Histidine kinase-, DNA gyrase B-, and HSP90-like ATPase
MTVLPGEDNSLLQSLSIPPDPGWQTSPVLQQHLRENHSKRGGDYIDQRADELKLPRHLVGQLDWMMKSHNMSIPELDASLSAPFAAEERVIDVRQLSILLCVADAIEFSDTRVVDGVLDLIKKDPSKTARKSYLENMKHICVGDSLAVERDGRIVVSGAFNESEVLSLAHHTFDQIEEWLKGYCDIERRSAVRRLLIRPEPLQRRLELRGGRFERLGVRIDKKNIIDLISSNAIWKSDAGAVVRELVQNSVEACRYRAFHSPPSASYQPKVVILFDRISRTVSVEDNGCGMSERVILNHFLTVGNSRAKEKAYSTKGFAPIARFGIGFWSVFTIAERAIVQTLAFEGANIGGGPELRTGTQFEVEIEGLKDYTVFLERAMLPGTTVTLSLKPDIIVDDLYSQAKDKLLCSEVPIDFRIDSDSDPLPLSVPDVSDDFLLGPKLQRKAELGIEIFKWRGAKGDIDVALSLLYRKGSGRPTFLGQDGAPILFGPEAPIRWPISAICGFRGGFFNPTNSLCFDLPRVGSLNTNWKNPRGFEYAIDRQALLENETKRNATTAVVDLVHSAYREFLRTTDALNDEAIYELNNESRIGGGDVFDLFTGTQLSEMYASSPDLLCFKLAVVRLVLTSSNVPEIRYFDATKLARQKGTAWVIQSSLLLPAGGLQQFFVHPNNLLSAAYKHAQSRLSQAKEGEEFFFLEPNVLASMLFDCDPESTVEMAEVTVSINPQLQMNTLVPIQKINLETVRFAGGAQGILANVAGKWGGAIYYRTFESPNGKPYMFLGRQRVLIKPSSPLSVLLEDLKRQARFTKMADTVALLKQDEAGYPPAELSGLL